MPESVSKIQAFEEIKEGAVEGTVSVSVFQALGQLASLETSSINVRVI